MTWDDLTLNEVERALLEGWITVPKRTETELLLQLRRLLVSKVASTPPGPRTVIAGMLACQFTPAQRRRLWDNCPEHHAYATSRSGFERIVALTELAHGMIARGDGGSGVDAAIEAEGAAS